MSGGSDTTTTSQSIPDWMRPYAENYMQASTQVANLPYQSYGGQTTAQLNPYQTAGYNAQAQRAIQGSGVNDAASGQLQDTLNGKYLNNNPYLDQTINAAQSDAIRGYNQSIVPSQNAAMARSGSFGNSGIQQSIDNQNHDFGQTLGNIGSTIRANDYGNERSRQMSAIGMAPSIANQDYVDASALQNAGQGFQSQEQKNLTDQYGRFQEANNYPQTQLNTLGKGLGFNFGQNSSSTGPGTNGWAQGVGTAATMYGLSNYGNNSTTTSGGGK
jgi:hypothetical protein